jgi:glycosyltransferase involved in cell wall biosynthesis
VSGRHLLSVVIPTHNRAERVGEAAASVLAQQLPAHTELEVVIVDDGSTDATAAMVETLAGADGRVRAVSNPHPVGPCEARNRGIAATRGDLLATCDDDDAWAADAALTMLDYLALHPEVGAASAWHDVEHGRQAVPFRGPIAYGAEALLWFNVVAIPFLFIRREAFAADPWYDPAFVTGEDWELCLRCALERPMRTVPASLYRFRQHGGARVTAATERHRAGRAALVAKHGGLMTAGCVAYHRAVIDLLDGARADAGRHLAGALATHPTSGARAVAMLVGGRLAGRVGVRRGDPGRAARLSARLAGSGDDRY